jgi:RNA-directed DNA polymerase
VSLAEKITSDLNLTLQYVELVARTASHRYKSYSIPKKTGGFRTINHPARELKLFQRWLIKNLFSRLPVHRSACAYKKGSSVYRNASQHRTRNFLLKVDFRDFFPSIRGHDLVRHLRINSDSLRGVVETAADRELVRRLVCRDDRLTIGAPSSPILSNLVMYEFDQKWTSYCREKRIAYSRYADDLYFSTNERGVLEVALADLKRDLRQRHSPVLQINEEKTVFTSRKRRKLVTGLVLTPEGTVSLGRKKKRFLRALIHRKAQGQLPDADLSFLRGSLAYARSVEPEFLERLLRKYGAQTMDSVLAAPA